MAESGKTAFVEIIETAITTVVTLTPLKTRAKKPIMWPLAAQVRRLITTWIPP